jgi:acyl-CoA reductase-like NAD-dependent aldehyde dehydrogenase
MERFLPYIQGEFRRGESVHSVYNSFSGELVGEYERVNLNQVKDALESAQNAFFELSRYSAMEKSNVLKGIAEELHVHKEEMSKLISLEASKSILLAEAEVDRAIECFRIASEECFRLRGEYIALDRTLAGLGKEGWVKRFPMGVVVAISPFNFPLNLAVHKIAPALAVGCCVVLKPSSTTPLSCLYLARLIHGLGLLPAGAFNVLPCDRKTGMALVKSSIPSVLSFTGSDSIGWELRGLSGKKKCILELGGNSAFIVGESADLSLAISQGVRSAFDYQGQVCIHAQRFFVHQSQYDSFKEGLVSMASLLVPTHPLESGCTFSSMIDESNALRVYGWAEEAIQGGAKKLLGALPRGACLSPWILEGTHSGMKVNSEEVFGPLVTLTPISSMEEGIRMANASRYGLQTSVYTQEIKEMDMAFSSLQCGGVVLNAPPTFRVDHMPYGGEKDSGTGREGIAYAMEEMTYPKILVKEKGLSI